MYEALSKKDKIDLTDICNYLKAVVIPRTPEDFIVAEPFRHDLTDDEINAGISAFRAFLYELYDRIAADKGRFTTAISEGYTPEAHINTYYPIISDLALILFSLGFHGRLETNPKKELVVDKAELTGDKKKDKRKLEAYRYLAEAGFYFEDADFLNERESGGDLSKPGTFYVQYEKDENLLTGLKLIAQAQANIKNKPHEYEKTFMRCDFYPLASTKPMIQKVNIHEFVDSQPPEVQEWILKMNSLLTENGCKVDDNLNRFRGSCTFAYMSRKHKKRVCQFQIGISGFIVCVSLADKQDLEKVLRALPDDVRSEYITNETKGCGGCNTFECGINLDFEEAGKIYRVCTGSGYIRRNPTPEQFKMIERFIDIRREYLNKINKKVYSQEYFKFS